MEFPFQINVMMEILKMVMDAHQFVEFKTFINVKMEVPFTYLNAFTMEKFLSSLKLLKKQITKIKVPLPLSLSHKIYSKTMRK